MGDLLFEQPKDVVPLSREDFLLAECMKAGNIEVLERFIALRNSEERRKSELDFYRDFADMRSELPAIPKNKEVKRRSGAKMYDYAELDFIQSIVDPILIKKWKFAYSWREEAITIGDNPGKRTFCDLTKYGFTKSSSFDCPLLDPISSREGDSVTNTVQAAKGTSSYGRRASLEAVLGLVKIGEDSDGFIESLEPEILCDDLRKLIETKEIHPESVVMIKQELLKPLADRDIKKLRDWHKRAQSKPDKVAK